MALDEDLPEEQEDKTVPKYRQIDKRAGSYVIDWGEELEAQHQAWELENRGSTKRAADDEKAAAPKRAKASKTAANGDGEAPTDDDMRTTWENQNLSKLTMPVLKAWLSSKKLSVGGKKAELVDRVEQWFESKG